MVDRYQQADEAVLATLDLQVNRQAAMIAYIDDFWMMWITLAAVLSPFLCSARANPQGRCRPPRRVG